MNQFLRKLLNLDVLGHSVTLNLEQAETIKRLRRELALKDLSHVRAIRDLVEQFFIAQEAGLDVRDQLEAGLTDLRDHVARLEEHSGV